MNGGLADGGAKEVGGHLGDTFQGDELLNAQVDPPSAESRAVWDGGVDAGGERRGHLAAGGGTDFDFDLMFGHDQLLRRQVEDLPAVVTDDGPVAEGGPATAGAAPQPMDDGAVGVNHLGQSLSWMAGLPTRRAAALFAQALGFGFGVAVRGRRLMAVAAVLGELGFQFGDPLLQDHEPCHEPCAQRTSGGTWGCYGGEV